MAARTTCFRKVAHSIAISLLLMLTISMMGTTSAYAEEAEEAGWEPNVTVSTDKASYGDAESVTVTASATNDSGYYLTDASLTAAVPEGYTLISGDSTVSTETLANGDALSITYTLASSSTPAAVATDTLAKTGDTLLPILPIILLILAAAALMAASLRSGKRGKHAKNTISLVLALVLVTTMSPLALAPAYAADETDETTITLEEAETMDATGSAAWSVGENQHQSSATFQAAWGANYELTSNDLIAARQVDPIITITSEHPFASTLNANNLTLNNDLADCTIKSVTLADANTVVVQLSGEAGYLDGVGTILFGEGSFENPASTGYVCLSTEFPTVRVQETSTGYDSSTDLFAIPVTMDRGAFAESLDPSWFEIGDGVVDDSKDSSIQGTTVRVEAVDRISDTEVVLYIRVGATDASTKFSALDYELTNGGVDIDAQATNCGALVGINANVEEAKQFNYTTTALDYATAFPVGLVKEASGISYNSADNTYTGQFSIDLVVSSGSVKIGNDSDAYLVDLNNFDENGNYTSEENHTENCAYTTATLSRTSDTSLLVTVTSSADVASEAADKNSEEAYAAASSSMQNALQGHALKLTDGALLNAWGIAQNGEAADLIDGNIEEAAVNSIANGEKESKSTSDKADELVAAQKALQISESGCKTVGNFISAIGAGSGSSGSAASAAGFGLQAAGGLLGTAASVIGIFTPGDNVTLAQVMQNVSDVKSQLSTVQREVEVLSKQLTAIEKRGNLANDVKTLQALFAHGVNMSAQISDSEILSMIRSMSDTELKTWCEKDGAALFASTNESDKKQVAAMKALATKIDMISTKYDGYTSPCDAANKFYILLTDNGTISASSVVTEYFECIDTYYNWESEALAARANFLSTVTLAYLATYYAAQEWVHVQYWTAETTEEKDSYKTMETMLFQQAAHVMQSLYGTFGTSSSGQSTELTKPSAIYQQCNVDTSKYVKNLVDGYYYATDGSSFSSIYYDANDDDGANGFILSDFRATEPSDLPRFKISESTVTTFTSSTLKIMAGRTKESILEEMYIVGEWVDTKVSARTGTKYTAEKKKVVTVTNIGDSKNGYKGLYHFITSDVTQAIITDKTGIKHKYAYNADYYDISTTSNPQTTGGNQTIYLINRVYKAGTGWHTYTELNCTMIATPSTLTTTA